MPCEARQPSTMLKWCQFTQSCCALEDEGKVNDEFSCLSAHCGKAFYISSPKITSLGSWLERIIKQHDNATELKPTSHMGLVRER